MIDDKNRGFPGVTEKCLYSVLRGGVTVPNVADGEATIEYVAEAYDISVELVEQIIAME